MLFSRAAPESRQSYGVKMKTGLDALAAFLFLAISLTRTETADLHRNQYMDFLVDQTRPGEILQLAEHRAIDLLAFCN
jgi:hypothetical protein